MLTQVGKPRAKVRVCNDPLLGGISEALKFDRLDEIIRRYQGMVDLFLLCVDRDGETGRRIRLDNLEQQVRAILPVGREFFADNAWQELEVWALAGHDLLPGWVWQEIRVEVNPKETYFNDLARQHGVQNEPAGGRKTLGIEAARRYARIRQLCSEDIGNLERRIQAWIEGRS